MNELARLKNAQREHYIQDYIEGEQPEEQGWLQLAHYITEINDSTEEETEDEAFYSGDGTPERTILSIAEAYDVVGQYDPEDPAQELIASKKRTISDRKVWHRIVRSDGKKEWVGRATLSNIIAGSGPASGYEEFGCNIRFDEIPEETETEGNGDNGGGGVEG